MVDHLFCVLCYLEPQLTRTMNTHTQETEVLRPAQLATFSGFYSSSYSQKYN
jgi:hypothetical protein